MGMGAKLAAAKRLQFGLVIVAVFALSLVLNAATPLIADDYTFAYIFRTPFRVQSLADIAQSQRVFYMTWSGRVVGGFFEQLAVLVGKPTFNVVNSLMMVALVLLVYFNANGLRRIRVSLLAGIPIMLWFALPSFGQSVLFAAGATNYLWTSAIVLAALLPFRLHAERPGVIGDSIWLAAAFVPLALLAGLSNENMGPATVLLMGASLVMYRRRGGCVPRWAISGTAGSFVGTCLLIGAPGNYSRLAEAGASAAHLSVSVLADRFLSITHAIFLNNLFALLAAFIVLTVFAHEYGSARRSAALLVGSAYMVAAFLATYAMMLSPYFAPRTWTGIIVLGVTAAGVVYSDIDFDRRFIRRLVTVTLCFGIVIFAVKFAYVYAVDVRPFGEQWVDRVNLIQEAKASGRHDLAVPAVVAKTTYNASYDIKDLDPNPAEWPNADVARFYGVSSIRVD
jgi:hypothetical protein